MADDGWSVLYTRVRTPVLDRIKAAAAADERSVAKWIEIHFRDYFEKVDSCSTSISTSDQSAASDFSSSPGESASAASTTNPPRPTHSTS